MWWTRPREGGMLRRVVGGWGAEAERTGVGSGLCGSNMFLKDCGPQFEKLRFIIFFRVQKPTYSQCMVTASVL